MPPAFLTEPLQPTTSYVILEGFSMLVRKMCQLHWRDIAIHDQGAPESSPEAEKQHSAAFVAPQGLHRGVVYQLDWMPEGFGEVEFDPSLAKIARLHQGEIVD